MQGPQVNELECDLFLAIGPKIPAPSDLHRTSMHNSTLVDFEMVQCQRLSKTSWHYVLLYCDDRMPILDIIRLREWALSSPGCSILDPLGLWSDAAREYRGSP